MIGLDQLADDHLATVIAFPTAAREYRRRVHEREPDAAAQPLAYFEWVIEQRLSHLWDQARDPFAGLAFLPAVVGGEPVLSARAVDLLRGLFDAADDAAEETLTYGRPSMRAMDEHSSCLWDLANCLRGGTQ